MNPLIIPSTEQTPAINFDVEKLLKGKHVFEISGESMPENVQEFYEPVIQWLIDLQKYMKTIEDKANDSRQRKIRLKFKMDYFNSSSAKYLFDIIQKLEQLKHSCHNVNVKIIWLYHPADNDMLEAGEEFKSMTGLPFELSALQPGEAAS